MKEKNIVDFYLLCNKLKNVIRTGWKVWNVKAERLESVAEHIFGTQMLAIAMFCEYQYNIDFKKVILMIAIHETEEIIIGDLTCNDANYNNKNLDGHKAVKQIFSTLSNSTEIENLIYEFDECKTEEAKFAYYCDKLECDIQAKIYDENGQVNVNKQYNNTEIEDFKEYNKEFGVKTFSNYWLEKDRQKIGFDKNFQQVSKYLTNNKI